MPRILLLFLVLALATGCAPKAEKSEGAFKSIEQIHREEGIPIRVREVGYEDFATSLKFPAVLKARSESAASAPVADVVREIHFTVGDYVNKDQVVVSFGTSNMIYRQAKVSFENAEAAFKRSVPLYESKGISQQAFDNIKAQYTLAENAYKAADDMINVKAPISGFITRLNVKVSEKTDSGNPLFTVSNLELIEGQVWVSASEIAGIRLGQPAAVEWQGKKIAGRVTRVNLIMDSEKKAFLVLTEFRNPGRTLTSGITADISIETYRSDRAVVVQRKELLREGGKFYAYVVQNNTAEKRELLLGADQGFLFELKDGLRPGDLLIIEGHHQVREGSKIKIIPVDGPAAPNT
jgi:RND family efflux transporter MFP subunit